MRPAVIHSGRRRSTSSRRSLLLILLVLFIIFMLYKFNSSNKNSPTEEQKQQPEVLENEVEDIRYMKTDDISFDDPKRAGFPRIFCMIPSQPHAREKFRTILDTWGIWCDGLRFTIDPKEYSEPGKEHLQPEEEVEEITSTDGSITGKIVMLNKLVRKKGNRCFTGASEYNPKTKKNEPVFTACRHIWEKVWRSWVYVADHLAEDYDFFFKVDDDTFFFVPAMREVIIEKGFKESEYHYFGQRVFPIGPDKPLIAGALVGFSRATLKAVAAKYKTMEHEYGDRRNFKHGRCVDRDGATEEVTTSICLASIGIAAEPLYDETVMPRRPHMLLWMPRDMLTFTRRDNSSSWFYKHAPRDVGTLENCCSTRPVGFHFMRADSDLRRVKDLIMDPQNKLELEKTVKEKVPIWLENPTKYSPCVFDHMPFPGKTCALEAQYWLDVKKKWHERDPINYRRRLYD